jgi:hypothetical protein
MPLLMVLANLAMAQDGSATYLDSHMYHPPIESEGMLWTEDAGIAPDGLSQASIQSTYIYDPIFETGGGEIDGRGSRSQAMRLDVIGAAAVRGIQIGADVPVYVVNEDDLFDNPDASLGDIALDVKGGLIEAGEDNPINVGAGARVILPTTGSEVGGEAIGVDAVAWEARLLADGEVMDTLNLAANVGTRGLPDDVVDTDSFRNQFFFRAGAGLDVVEDAGLSLDVAGAFDYDTDFDDQEEPIQGILGGYARVAETVVIKGGLGSGLIPGVENDAIRGVLGIAYEPSRGFDEDLDTVGNNVDQCPGQSEDMDGFQDEDGCPDADNDRDNVADAADQCPDEAEDLDGIRDDDGCADDQNQVVVRIRDEQGRMIDAAKVTIEKDGQVVKTGSGSFTAELDPGMYTLRAESDQHQPVETTFRVYPDDQVQVSATLVESDKTPTLEKHETPSVPTEKELKIEYREEPVVPERDIDLEGEIEGDRDRDMPERDIDLEQDIQEGLEDAERRIEEDLEKMDRDRQRLDRAIDEGVEDLDRKVDDEGVKRNLEDVDLEDDVDDEGGEVQPEDLRDERIEEPGLDRGEPLDEEPLPEE